MRLEHDHSHEAIKARLAIGNSPNYVRDWVYGGIDGAVTTFAIVAGVVGAELSASIILILGLANLFADGFSMAASNYSGTKAEHDDLERLRQIEKHHIQVEPEGEREEIRQILKGKGLDGSTLEAAVGAITSNENIWIETMLAEEYGLARTMRQPLASGAATFIAFMACGAVPLAPFLLPLEQPFLIAAVLTAMTFFLIGSLKSLWSLAPWWRSGIETLVIGAAAAGMAYGIGFWLKGIA